MTETKKREAAHALMEMCMRAARYQEPFTLCTPCPFGDRKCREISTADWLLWMDENEQQEEGEKEPDLEDLEGGERYAAIISEERWADRQISAQQGAKKERARR